MSQKGCVFSNTLNDIWGSQEKHPNRNGLYSRVIIHPRFIHYFTLRQASIRIGFPHLPFIYVYEHFGGNGKCREFAEVPRHKAHAAESKSNLRCSRCIKNSFRLRRLTRSSFAASEMTKGRKEGRKKGDCKVWIQSALVLILSRNQTTSIFSSVYKKRAMNIRWSATKSIVKTTYATSFWCF